MNYHLDTNACVSVLRDRNSAVAAKLRLINPSDVAVCSVVRAELYYGAHSSNQPRKNLAIVNKFLASFRSAFFDDAAASIYGALRQELASQGRMIGPNDLLIASIALSCHAALVSHNAREFSRINKLPLEDWER